MFRCFTFRKHGRQVPVRRLAPRYQKQLAKNIWRLRERAQLTQEYVAEQVDVSVRYFQDIEAGVNCPSLQVLIDLRKTFDCSWNELFERMGPRR